MKKRLLLSWMVVLFAICGVYAQYTTANLEAAGWTKVTSSSISSVGDNYYMLVDANSSNYVMSNDATHYRPCYKTLANPGVNPSFVWVLEGSENVFALKSYSTGSYFIQADGWNTSVTGATGSTTFTFVLNEGKYSLSANGRSDYVGHWNDSGAAVANDGENIAANKAVGNAPGFYLYSIHRNTYDAALIAARETATAGASETTPYDATSWIQNADWSGDWGGWARSGSWGNQQWGKKTLESWNATNVIVKQELRGVPNGKYRVTADLISGPGATKAAFVFGTGNAKVSSAVVSAEASANNYDTMSNEVAGNTLTADNVIVTGNTITLGFDQSTGWIVADNFKLYYLGEDISIYEIPLAEAKAAALGVDQSAPMNASVLSELKSVISTYGSKALAAYSTGAEVTTAISALNTAVANANASIAEYTLITDYLTDAKAKFAGDYSAVETAIADGTYTDSTDGKAAVKARRGVVATTGMTANKDLTGLIDNNSFETGNTNYWTTTASSDTGAKSTTGSYAMSNSDGSYLFNTWWQGTPITQNIGTLPAGAYELKGVVASNGGTIYITMNDKHEAYLETVDAAGVGIEFSYIFTLDAAQEVTIGVVGGDNGTHGAHKAYRADGYWFYKVDNFRLKYLGATAPENTIDGTYYLSIGENYLSRGGDSGTEAAMKAEANRLPVQIVTDKAGISTIQMIDTRKYLFYSTSEVYTDGTVPTPAKTHHKPYWKISAVSGGYQILNTESGKYLTTVEVNRDGETLVATCSDTPATWTFTEFAALDYSTLESEIASSKTHVFGFEDGEYAPYTNKDALPTLTLAEDLFNNKKAISQAQITTMVNTLHDAWTANVGEVNAISWKYADYTDDTDSQVPIGWTNGDGGSIRISANHTANSGLKQLEQYMCLNINTSTAAIYGETTGYTLPLKASTQYRLTFRYAGWGNTSGTPSIVIKDAEDNEIETEIFSTTTVLGNNTTSAWTFATMVFTTTAAGNYKVSFSKTGNRTAFGDITLVKAVANNYTIAEGDADAPTLDPLANVTLTRTLKGGQWNGFSVPFGFTVAGSALDGAEVKKFKSVTDNEIILENATEIVAGEPYLVKPAADVVNPTFNGVVVSNPAEAVHGEGSYKFAAHLYNTALATDGSVAYVSTTDSSIKKLTSGSIKGLRAIFNIPTGAEAKALVVDFGEGTTGILNVDAEGNIYEGQIYNLAGQRVNMTQKGLYIVNGKKVLIK